MQPSHRCISGEDSSQREQCATGCPEDLAKNFICDDVKRKGAFMIFTFLSPSTPHFNTSAVLLPASDHRQQNLSNGWGEGASQAALVVRNPPANGGDLRDAGLFPGPGRSPGGGHGNPLQYSCLENPMDGGAWRATVHRVEKSQT